MLYGIPGAFCMPEQDGGYLTAMSMAVWSSPGKKPLSSTVAKPASRRACISCARVSGVSKWTKASSGTRYSNHHRAHSAMAASSMACEVAM